MRTIVEYGLANAAAATLLALMAVLVGLVVRRPAVRNALRRLGDFIRTGTSDFPIARGLSVERRKKNPKAHSIGRRKTIDDISAGHSHQGEIERLPRTIALAISLAAWSGYIPGIPRRLGVGALMRVYTSGRYIVEVATPSIRTSTPMLRNHVSNAAFDAW